MLGQRTKLGFRSRNPVLSTVADKSSLADIFLVIIGVCFAGVIIVVLLMAFGFLMEVQEVSGDLGVFLVIGIFLAALVLGNAAYHLINAVIEDIFG